MKEIDFTEAQKDAIFARNCSIAVSAAAGSGKTAVLTQRIIELVTAPDCMGDLSRILVVTFTKAAAAELVSRISDALDDVLSKDPGNRHIRSQCLMVPSAHISTIHSFCLDLIRTNFQRLGIPADFSAGDATAVALMEQEIAEELVSECFEGEALTDRPFLDFPRLLDTLEKTGNTDGAISVILSLYHDLSSTVAFLDGIDEKASAMQEAAEKGFDGTPWEKSIRSYLCDFFEHYKAIYEAALRYIKANPDFEKYINGFSDDLSYIEKFLDSLYGGVSYESLGGKISAYSLTKLSGVSKDLATPEVEFYKGKRSKFSKAIKQIRQTFFCYSQAAIKDSLAETAAVLTDLSTFLRAFEVRFVEEKARRKMITFADMERYALQLLWDKEKGEPTELALALRESYDEILIDEYQDTNEIQDRIFGLISRPDNRFNVGDKKQSIYSFRGAVPSIFEKELDARPKYEKETKVTAAKIFLSENFRSTAEVLGFCNGVFDTLMNTSTTSYGADERLNCGSGKHGPLPMLCFVSDEGSGEDEELIPHREAAFVAAEIARYLAGPKKEDGSKRSPSDVAILLRKTDGAASSVYEEALKKRGIPCRNTAVQAFFESPEVLLIVSLLHVIDNPSRDIYLAAALKSPLYGVTLDELVKIKRQYKDGSLFDALRRYTEATGFPKGKRFLDAQREYAMLAAEVTCDKLIWQIYLDTGIFSILSADKEREIYEIEEAKANLVMLYNYAKNFEKGGFKGLSGFVSFVGAVIAGGQKMDVSQFASPGEVVNITTIHKSKGLEYPVCFVCGMSTGFNKKELERKTIYHDTLGVTVKLTDKDGMWQLDTLMREAAILERRRHAVEEELRILYVALTRAKRALYVTATVKKKDMEKGNYDFGPDSNYAMEREFFSSYSIRCADGYMDMLLTAIAGMDGLFAPVYISDPNKDVPIPVYVKTEKTEKESEEKTEKESEEETEKDSEGEKAHKKAKKKAPKEKKDISLSDAKRLVHERLDFEYPHRSLTKIPSKLSVSRLYPEVLDDSLEGVAVREAPHSVTMPHFLLGENEKVTPTERGTAMHTFMQFCDFENVLSHGVEAEIARLIEKRFLFPSDGSKIDRRKLDAFFASDVAREMMASKNLCREKRFMLRFPASLFTKDETLSEETVLVQGVIDCAYTNSEGELVLLDYKTDHFARSTPRDEVEKTLRERHTEQLFYYKLACERLFGSQPKHTYLYAFALNDIVEIF